jgi:hypothetical protein
MIIQNLSVVLPNMGFTSTVRKCIHIEIRRKSNLINEKEWTIDTSSSICLSIFGTGSVAVLIVISNGLV